jgi:hypothetical protein
VLLTICMVLFHCFSSYDTQKHTSHKVSIGDGKQLSIVGYGNVKFLMVH